MSKPNASNLSAWQEGAIATLGAIAAANPNSIHVLGPDRTETGGDYAFVKIALPTKDLGFEAHGLQFLDQEEFIVGIHAWAFVPPLVEVEHTRFAGYPHVLQGHRLCIYLDPTREWDPRGGMPAFLERLWTWLGDAAAGRFNAATAMYHAVGGVLHRSAGTPTIVVRGAIPDKALQRAYLVSRTARRIDLAFEPAQTEGWAIPVFTLVAGLPFGAGVTLWQLLHLMDKPDFRGPLCRPGLWPTPGRGVLAALAASASRKPDGSYQYFMLAIPHPSGGPAHLLVGRLPVTASDELRRLVHDRGPIDIDPAAVSGDIQIEWCGVSDERFAVSTRRDDQRPVKSLQGKAVHIWGCGGLGSWVAEFVTRAGAGKISLCDPGAVTGGLLVRQDYVEEDIGQTKAEALAARLRAITDLIEVEVIPGALPLSLSEVLDSTDVVIDATVSIAIGHVLSDAAAAGRGKAVLAQIATDVRSGMLGILTVSAPTDRDGPATIDARAGKLVLEDSTLEMYHTFWEEPLDGHELTPTRGCSVPTFHGSAADLAAVAACLTNLVAMQLSFPTSGTHLIALPQAVGPHHRFIRA